MKEKIDYDNVENVALRIDTCRKNMDRIFKEIGTKMQEINQVDIWKSDASLNVLNKFNSSYQNFSKYCVELDMYNAHLKKKVEDYQEVLKTGAAQLQKTTSEFLSKVGKA